MNRERTLWHLHRSFFNLVNGALKFLLSTPKA